MNILRIRQFSRYNPICSVLKEVVAEATNNRSSFAGVPSPTQIIPQKENL